jgi:hypothetical protein
LPILDHNKAAIKSGTPVEMNREKRASGVETEMIVSDFRKICILAILQKFSFEKSENYTLAENFS